MNTLVFRVWDKISNYYWMTKDSLYFCRPEHDNVTGWASAWPMVVFVGDKDYVVQQFTGLLDKCGKMIFEGDIILISGDRRVVEWGKESAAWCFKGLSYEHPLHLQDGEFLVLGNIFKNPELA